MSPPSPKQVQLKSLTLGEAWSLYNVLHHALSKTDLSTVDEEIGYITDHAQDGTMLKCVNMMFDDLPEAINPFDTLLLFIKGIQLSGFMTFVAFIRGFDNGRK